MRAYGKSSDASSSFLRDACAGGLLTEDVKECSYSEFGWQEPEQQVFEVAPDNVGELTSFGTGAAETVKDIVPVP